MTFEKLYDELTENIKELTEKNGLKPSRIAVRCGKLFMPIHGDLFFFWAKNVQKEIYDWVIEEICVTGQDARIIVTKTKII